MSTNNKVSIADLEFDQIKQNLKTFLQGQSQFSDYDFDGSNLSILLDVLAYNTHYNAMYTNMALNEVYLDSASRRDSVVSLAKSLGYTPRSAVAASTTINFNLTGVPDGNTFLTVPRNTEFYGLKDNVQYTFVTMADVTAQRNSAGNYAYSNVEVKEGSIIENAFEYNESNYFVLPNTGVDVTTLKVRVQPNASTTDFETFIYAGSAIDVGANTPVYFLRENDEGKYIISFGDNVIGRQLSVGNIINVEYLVCSGEMPNGIKLLSYWGDALSGGTIEGITLNQTVLGGRYPETIEEIRFNAPNMYAAQNRAVTALDYEALLLSKVPAIEAVSVWGGENNIPPVYGKVFISAKTTSGRQLSILEQDNIITNYLNYYKCLSVIPEFVSPEYLEVELDIVAYYDPNLTTNTAETIASLIYDEIIGYDDMELQKFNKILRQSHISRLVEKTEKSIVSCVPRMKMYRTVTPYYNRFNTYTVTVGNPFTEGTISSSGFFINGNPNKCFIDDDGLGNLKLYQVVSGIRTDLGNVGTVNYTGGVLVIDSLNIVKIDGVYWKFSITPSSADIASIYNQIVLLDTAKLKINMVADTTLNGRALVGNKFTFANTRI